MATLAIDGTDLVVTLRPSERRWGLLRNLRIPLSSVSEVAVVDDGRSAVRGIRSPGLGGTQRLIGTWRASGNTQYVCVRRHQPAVKVTLEGQRYRTILIGADDAAALADLITSSSA
jgi:hypothetical protein